MAADDRPKPTTPPPTTTATQPTVDPKTTVEIVLVQEAGKPYHGPNK